MRNLPGRTKGAILNLHGRIRKAIHNLQVQKAIIPVLQTLEVPGVVTPDPPIQGVAGHHPEPVLILHPQDQAVAVPEADHPVAEVQEAEGRSIYALLEDKRILLNF